MKKFLNMYACFVVFLCSNIAGCASSHYLFSTYKADGYTESTGGIIQVSKGLTNAAGSNEYLRIVSLNGKSLNEELQLFVPAGKHRVEAIYYTKIGCSYVPWGGQYGGSSCSYSKALHKFQINVAARDIYEIRLSPDYTEVILTKGICEDYDCIIKNRQ